MSEKEKMRKEDWQGMEEWIARKVRVKKESAAVDAVSVGHGEGVDYQVFLEEASRSMIRFKRPEHLIRMIIRMIDEQVKTVHMAMFVFSKRKGYYQLIDSKGAEGVKIPAGFIKLAKNDSLVKFFEKRADSDFFHVGAISRDELKAAWKNNEEFKKDEFLVEIVPSAIKQMELMKADICIPVYYKRDLLGIFVLGGKLSGKKYSHQEISFFTTLANDVAMALSNAQLIQELHDKIMEIHALYEREHSAFIHTAISLAAAIDARDPYTRGHTERVTNYSLAMADELEDLPEAGDYLNFKETLHIAALLHDVGKIGVPDSILNKTSQLTKEEYDKVKEHTVTGATILYPIGELGSIAVEIRAHHERYDGKGYPDGLAGEKIPFIARVIAVSDAFDAITTDRPYRQRKMTEVAAQIIAEESGKQFDPIVVSAFLLAYRKGRMSVP